VCFSKICQENSSFIKILQERWVLYMKPAIHFVSYLIQFILEWEIFQTKVVENIKTRFMFNNFFLRKSCRLWDNVEKYSGARQAANDNIVWHMHVVCWITKATDAHSEYVILIAFPLQQGLHKCTSVLCYTSIAHLDSSIIDVLSSRKL